MLVLLRADAGRDVPGDDREGSANTAAPARPIIPARRIVSAVTAGASAVTIGASRPEDGKSLVDDELTIPRQVDEPLFTNRAVLVILGRRGRQRRSCQVPRRGDVLATTVGARSAARSRSTRRKRRIRGGDRAREGARRQLRRAAALNQCGSAMSTRWRSAAVRAPSASARRRAQSAWLQVQHAGCSAVSTRPCSARPARSQPQTRLFSPTTEEDKATTARLITFLPLMPFGGAGVPPRMAEAPRLKERRDP
jgi:hypothetical protein